MQKYSFINIIIIATTIITMPIMSMEESSLTATEIPSFIVTLNLREAEQKYVERPINRYFDERDKHACTVLGITWEDNNNKYWVNEARLRKSNDTTDFCCWTNVHPNGVPLSTIPNPSYDEPLQHAVQFPRSLPASFVEQLKKEKSITLKNSLFAEPVEIILKLKSIENDSVNINISETSHIDLLKEFPSTPKTTPKANSKFKVYIIPGIAVTGIIALLIYLYKNNQLDTQFSQITNFMHSLTSANKK